MSGHSKWSKIKHQKGVDDVKRGNLFTKLTREIIIAAKEGGGNPDTNFRLRLAVQKARDSNMPMDNIDRAIKKGSGELEGGSLVEMTLEGYGPSGMAIMVSALSDNRNRTVQEVRSTFTRHGGSLGESGCVSWIFESRGVINIKAENVDADELALTAIDARRRGCAGGKRHRGSLYQAGSSGKSPGGSGSEKNRHRIERAANGAENPGQAR